MECVIMSLEALADEIAAQAKAEAKALKDEAKKTARTTSGFLLLLGVLAKADDSVNG